jgi:hypothetical protein
MLAIRGSISFHTANFSPNRFLRQEKLTKIDLSLSASKTSDSINPISQTK